MAEQTDRKFGEEREAIPFGDRDIVKETPTTGVDNLNRFYMWDKILREEANKPPFIQGPKSYFYSREGDITGSTNAPLPDPLQTEFKLKTYNYLNNLEDENLRSIVESLGLRENADGLSKYRMMIEIVNSLNLRAPIREN